MTLRHFFKLRLSSKSELAKQLFLGETNQQKVHNNLFVLRLLHAWNAADTKGRANGKGVEPVTTYKRVLFTVFRFSESAKWSFQIKRSKKDSQHSTRTSYTESENQTLSGGAVFPQQSGNRVQPAQEPRERAFVHFASHPSYFSSKTEEAYTLNDGGGNGVENENKSYTRTKLCLQRRGRWSSGCSGARGGGGAADRSCTVSLYKLKI